MRRIIASKLCIYKKSVKNDFYVTLFCDQLFEPSNHRRFLQTSKTNIAIRNENLLF